MNSDEEKPDLGCVIPSDSIASPNGVPHLRMVVLDTRLGHRFMPDSWGRDLCQARQATTRGVRICNRPEVEHK